MSIPAETRPLEHRRPAATPLPDEAERAAAELAAFVLAERPDSAAAALQKLELEEARLRREGKSATGLSDNARDLLHTLAGPRGYREQTVRMLDEEKLDPALRRQLESYLERDPLLRAEQRLREDRTRKLAATFNRLTRPLSRLATSGVVNPVETGRAAVAALLIFHSFPEATPQERQALHAYQEFLERNPDSPEAEWVIGRVEQYQRKWLRHLHGEALDVASQALEAGRPDVCLAHLERADRLLPEDPETRELRRKALKLSEERTERVERALSAVSVIGVPLDVQARDLFDDLSAATLSADSQQVAERARSFEGHTGPGPLSDELSFIRALGVRETGKEDAFFEAMGEVARLRMDWSNMARHALWIGLDPEQSPYSHYRSALRADRNGGTFPAPSSGFSTLRDSSSPWPSLRFGCSNTARFGGGSEGV
jgi:tetratricopeptide (TPR) repeat protein